MSGGPSATADKEHETAGEFIKLFGRLIEPIRQSRCIWSFDPSSMLKMDKAYEYKICTDISDEPLVVANGSPNTRINHCNSLEPNGIESSLNYSQNGDGLNVFLVPSNPSSVTDATVSDVDTQENRLSSFVSNGNRNSGSGDRSGSTSTGSGSFHGFDDREIIYNEIDIGFSGDYWYYVDVCALFFCLRSIFYQDLILFAQEQGDRIYDLADGEIKLLSKTMNDLLEYNTTFPTAHYDYKYLRKLAIDVFGVDCLKVSSVFGTRARNANIRHKALDASKLNFIRGMSNNYLLPRMRG